MVRPVGRGHPWNGVPELLRIFQIDTLQPLEFLLALGEFSTGGLELFAELDDLGL